MIVRTPDAPRPTRPPVGPASDRNSVSEIRTERLCLNALKSADLNALMVLFAQKSVARMTHAIPHPFTEADARALIDKARINATPRLPVFAIRRAVEGDLIGLISLERTTCGQTSNLHQFGPSVGMSIAPAFQAQGYGLEALEAVIGYAQRIGGHKIIHAAHFTDNAASAKMLVKADFLYTGRRTLESSRARLGRDEVCHMIRLL